jgi:tight adherence protein B
MAAYDLLGPELSVAVVVFLGILGLSLAVGMLGGGSSSLLQARLARHTVRVSSPPARLRRVELLGRSASPSNLLARKLSALKFVTASRQALVKANVGLGVGRYYLMRLLVAAVVFAVVQVALGIVALSLTAAAIGFVLPRIVVGKLISRRAAAFEAVLAETLDLIVGSLRAGQGLLQAIESTSYEQPEPMRSELRRIVGQVTMGVSLSDAMESLATRFASQDTELLAAAIAINRETGGNLTEVLDRLANTVRQRREVRAEAKALTAAPRATSYILAILPIAIAGYCIAISPIYRYQLLQAPLGRLLLIGAVIWSLIGFFISQKLAKAEL